MLFKKNEKSTGDFWREYEEKTGEKVLARGLGQYLSGWDEFDRQGGTSIWGLIIASSGGFRFHHFPQTSWLDAFSRGGSQEAQKEKTIFIPKEMIISAELIREKVWWKKLFKYAPPRLSIYYNDGANNGGAGNERHLLLKVDLNPEELAEKLCFKGS